MRLLIIEDEPDLALPMQKVLQREGFAVDYADDGEKGLNLAKLNDYDCLLLDLNLPKIDGIELAKQLRARQNNVPIIMVTARSQIYNKLEGFAHGADDYVVKPFDMVELIARIKVVIKRNSANKLLVLKFSNCELIPEQNLVKKYLGQKVLRIDLTTKETGVLEYLLRNKGRLVSTEAILEHVWDQEVDLFTDTVKTHIKTLRQKIDPQKKIIQNIRNKGYRIEI